MIVLIDHLLIFYFQFDCTLVQFTKILTVAEALRLQKKWNVSWWKIELKNQRLKGLEQVIVQVYSPAVLPAYLGRVRYLELYNLYNQLINHLNVSVEHPWRQINESIQQCHSLP